MKNKKNLFILLIIIFISAAIVLFFTIKNNNTNKLEYHTLVYKQIYNYPYKVEYIIQNNGEIQKSNIIDELTADGPPKTSYKKVGEVSSSDLQSIKEIIEIMNNETLKRTDFSMSYGMSIAGEAEEHFLYSCEYFSQENVDILNNIVSKYISL